MINFSNEIGKRQPASKMMRAGGLENSLGETRKEGTGRRELEVERWHHGQEAGSCLQDLCGLRVALCRGLRGPWEALTGQGDREALAETYEGTHTGSQSYTPGHCPHLPGAPRPTLSKRYKIWSHACLSSWRTEMTLIRERGVELGSSLRGFPSASQQSHLCTGATMGMKQPRHWLLTCRQSARLWLPESHAHSSQTVAQLLPSQCSPSSKTPQHPRQWALEWGHSRKTSLLLSTFSAWCIQHCPTLHASLLLGPSRQASEVCTITIPFYRHTNQAGGG